MAVTKTKTCFFESIINKDIADCLFDDLCHSIKWKNEIKSKGQPTRLSSSVDLEDHPFLNEIVQSIVKKVDLSLLSVYLNYYQDGNDWTPNHSHPGTIQFVLSLGGKRTLHVGKKEYPMKSGDGIIFGSSTHGVPKEEGQKEGRISVALFLRRST